MKGNWGLQTLLVTADVPLAPAAAAAGPAVDAGLAAVEGLVEPEGAASTAGDDGAAAVVDA